MTTSPTHWQYRPSILAATPTQSNACTLTLASANIRVPSSSAASRSTGDAPACRAAAPSPGLATITSAKAADKDWGMADKKCLEAWASIDWDDDLEPGVYEVSSHGRLRSYRRQAGGRLAEPRVLTGGPDAYGYRRANLTLRDGSKRSYKIHRLVAFAFLGPPPSEQHQVAHNDGVPLNNVVSNLRWATPSENLADRLDHGTMTLGTKNGRAKLSEAQVLEIRNMFKRGATYREVSARFSISQGAAGSIKSGKNWGWLDHAS